MFIISFRIVLLFVASFQTLLFIFKGHVSIIKKFQSFFLPLRFQLKWLFQDNFFLLAQRVLDDYFLYTKFRKVFFCFLTHERLGFDSTNH